MDPCKTYGKRGGDSNAMNAVIKYLGAVRRKRMERLTKINEHGTAHFYPQCFEKCEGTGYSRKCDNCNLLDRVCDKLGEYEDLEEQGKLLKLPAPIGSLVYGLYQFMGEGDWEIDVHKIRLEDLDRIGKTVFLTSGEAESALKRILSRKGKCN